MKTLYLLRHAKSSWSDAALADFERPLNERGLRAAQRIGEFIRERGVELDVVLCSPAVRARETARLVLEAAGIGTADVRYEPRIYEATAGELLEVLTGAGGERVMLVGHNYGIEQLLAQLTGEARHMSTASLARITLPVESWSEIDGATQGTLVWFVKPKDLA